MIRTMKTEAEVPAVAVEVVAAEEEVVADVAAAVDVAVKNINEKL